MYKYCPDCYKLLKYSSNEFNHYSRAECCMNGTFQRVTMDSSIWEYQ